jgi:hypothetical protein
MALHSLARFISSHLIFCVYTLRGALGIMHRRAEQNRAEQNRAEQSRTEQGSTSINHMASQYSTSITEQIRADQKFKGTYHIYIYIYT